MTQPRQTLRQPLRHVQEAYVSVTGATYTAKAGDRIIGVNRAGIVTITLPTAQLRPGRIYTVKDESGAAATNNITVATEGAETIDGSATDTISTNYGAKDYYSDGTNWFTVPLLPLAAHQSNHNSGGSDALKLDDLSAPDDNTDLNFSTIAHGLVPKGTDAGNFLKDDGSWAAPASSSDISARVTHSVNQSIADNTETALAFDTEIFDTDTIHDNVTNNSRLTCKTAGKYLIIGEAVFASNTTGHRRIVLYLNGTTQFAIQRWDNSQGVGVEMVVTCLFNLAVNDYVELRVYQNSGGALNALASSPRSPTLSMIKVLA